MRVLFDTNILIDVLQKRKDFYIASFEVFKAVANEQIEGVITATSITDIIYLMRKHIKRDEVANVLQTLFGLFTICDVKKDDLLHAISLDMPDYEDAVQAACAQRVKADFIVTRDHAGFTASPITAMQPKDAIKAIAKTDKGK